MVLCNMASVLASLILASVTFDFFTQVYFIISNLLSRLRHFVTFGFFHMGFLKVVILQLTFFTRTSSKCHFFTTAFFFTIIFTFAFLMLAFFSLAFFTLASFIQAFYNDFLHTGFFHISIPHFGCLHTNSLHIIFIHMAGLTFASSYWPF
jgi:hypothetical protein